MMYRIIRKILPSRIDYNSVVLFSCDLNNISPAVHLINEDFESHIISSAQSRLFSLLCSTFPKKSFQLRFMHGSELVYVLTYQGKLAAYAWVTTSICSINEIQLSLKMQKGCIYIYDCYVLPEFRNKGLYKSLLNNILKNYSNNYSSNDSYKIAFIAAEPSNTVSIRGIKKAGFKRLAHTGYIKLGQHLRYFGMKNLIELLTTSDLSNLQRKPSGNQHDAQ